MTKLRDYSIDVIRFLWKFIIKTIVYTFSVIPAAATDAWGECRAARFDRLRRRGMDDQPRSGCTFVVAKDTNKKPRRRRRGHRGGKRHHKNKW